VRCPSCTLSCAIVQDVYGSADCLRLSRIGKAIAAADEVLVQVPAAGVDRSVRRWPAG
jgi:hypothetical protein